MTAPAVKNILIIGGGITGLSLRHSLRAATAQTQTSTRQRQRLRIVVAERAPKPGGWIQSPVVDDFLFEMGPRSLAPRNGDATIALLETLSLQRHVCVPSKEAAKRYVWLNGRLELLPTGLLHASMLRQPMRSALLPILGEPWRSAPSPLPDDESIFDFVARRLSPHVASYMIDPMIGGIYAGDPRRLSIHSCLGVLPQFERDEGSIIRGVVARGKRAKAEREAAIAAGNAPSNFVRMLRAEPLYSFHGGVETLTNALLTHDHTAAAGGGGGGAGIVDSAGVDINGGAGGGGGVRIVDGSGASPTSLADALRRSQQHTDDDDVVLVNTSVTRLSFADSKVSAELSPSPSSSSSSSSSAAAETIDFDHVFSTIDAGACAFLLETSAAASIAEASFVSTSSSTSTPASASASAQTAALLPSLAAKLREVKYATVATVNVGYRRNDVLKHPGFGFLVPSTANADVLGCVFDSSSFPTQRRHADDAAVAGDAATTRLTVMMGGDRGAGSERVLAATDAEKETMALRALDKMLGIKAEPDAVHTRVHTDCIPQYYVGHTTWKGEFKKMMADLPALSTHNNNNNNDEGDVVADEYRSGLTLLGTAFNGVSVNDCITHSERIANEFVATLKD
jgi:protoporphyrinogen oxidase